MVKNLAIINLFIKEEENKLIEKRISSFVPLSQNVPGYTIKKLQTKSRLGHVSTGSPRGIQTRKVFTEKWLQSAVHLLEDALI